jgi:hypothetical protein
MNLKLGFDSIGLTEIFLTKNLKSKGWSQIYKKNLHCNCKQVWNHFGRKKWKFPSGTLPNVKQSGCNFTIISHTTGEASLSISALLIKRWQRRQLIAGRNCILCAHCPGSGTTRYAPHAAHPMESICANL